MLENVTGFLTSHGGEDFLAAMRALNELGYSTDPIVVDATWFVPQSRPRMFVIGSLSRGALQTRERNKQYAFDESAVRPKALASFILMHPEINWSLRALPEPPSRALKLDEVLEDLPDGAPEWWNSDRSCYLLSQMSERHRSEADRMIAQSRWSHGTVFRRVRNGKSMAELRTDGIAGCLRTPKGGSGRQILVKCGFGRFLARLLTARECARLMGAGDYSINVPLNQALFGFGDAVCVDAVAWVAQHHLAPSLDELRVSV